MNSIATAPATQQTEVQKRESSSSIDNGNIEVALVVNNVLANLILKISVSQSLVIFLYVN